MPIQLAQSYTEATKFEVIYLQDHLILAHQTWSAFILIYLVQGHSVSQESIIPLLQKRFVYHQSSTIPHKNIETNDKCYRKVAFLMYTEMVNFWPQS